MSLPQALLQANHQQSPFDLQTLGFQAFDALHIACAEFADVDALLTTDDRLLRKAIKYQTNLNVEVANPVTWFMKVTSSEEDKDDFGRN
jgi:hypothetical protein